MQGQVLYRTLMAVPRRQATEWRLPFALTLACLSSAVLFLLPVKSSVAWDSFEAQKKFKDKQQTFVFVGNRNMYALDAIPLMAAIYKNTGIWPRFATDPHRKTIYLFWGRLGNGRLITHSKKRLSNTAVEAPH
jgi:hypothetical protein